MARTHIVDVHNLVITNVLVLVISRQDELMASLDRELKYIEHHSSKSKFGWEFKGRTSVLFLVTPVRISGPFCMLS